MKARPAFPHFALVLILVLSGGLSRGAEQDMRQANFGAFTVITDAKEKEVAAWVAEFDGFRHVVQDLMGIKDEQLLPLTIVLLAKQEDVRELGPAVQRAVSDVLLLSVGLGQQPMIATAVEHRSAGTEIKVRTGTVMWLLSSAGINYDPWIVQGCIDLFGNLQIKLGEVRSTRLIETHMKQLNRASKYAAPRVLDLNHVPSEPVYAWVALHYLLIGREGWKGTSALAMYQRTVAGGWGREEAFTAAFGLPLAEANGLINEYLKRGRVSEVRLTAAPSQPAPNLQLLPLTAGMRDCLFCPVHGPVDGL